MTSGFTIVRNARRLDYPFEESIASLVPLCDEVIINCGDSQDDTREICEKLKERFAPKIRLLFSTWEEKGQSGGFQLKSQTDAAIAACRGQWCFYLQADEVLHEADYPQIREAQRQADMRQEIDGVVFDYRHFYGSYRYEIRGRNWYRREVRLFKNGRGIEAFRDAQGFRKGGARLLAIASGARVFHYGYVRNSQSLKAKSGEMSKWWGEKATEKPGAYQLKRHVGLSRYHETHPAVMKVRLEGYRGDFDPKSCPRVWDRTELKNALTLAWETVFPFRLGEFRNFDVKSL